MSGIKYPFADGLPNETSEGADFFDATKQVAGNFTLLDRRADFADGTLGRGRLGFAGDSMSGYATEPTWYSPIATARMLHYNFDLLIDSRNYYTKAVLGIDNKLPDGQRGYNFAKGQTDTIHLRDVQLPFIKESPPEYLFLSTFQNDAWFNDGEAAVSVDIVQGVIPQILDLGTKIVMLGVHPHTGKGEGTLNAYGRHYVEGRMRNWADRQAGLSFVPILDLLKSGDPVEEAKGLVNWKGVKAKVGGATIDDIHTAPYGARLISKAIADAFRPLVGLARVPAYEAFDFDETRNPYANYLGAAGRLVGSGGKINGVTSAAIPAGLELLYDPNKGYTVTPVLTGNPAYPLRLTFAGTPNANDIIALRFLSSKRMFPAQAMEIHGKARWVGMNGLAGIAVGQGELGVTSGIIPVRNPVGGCGQETFVMPHQLDEEITFHSAQPAGMGNEYSQPFRLDMATAVIAGIPVSGALEVGRLGYFRSDNAL